VRVKAFQGPPTVPRQPSRHRHRGCVQLRDAQRLDLGQGASPL